MKAKNIAIVVLLLVSIAFAGPYMTFDEFITKFSKHYTKGSQEYAQKEKIYNFNVQQLQSKNCSICGVTKFFDIPTEQFTKKILNLQIPTVKVSASPSTTPQLTKVGAPPSVDWRTTGVITSIKDQGDCGCCWSFATCALAQSFLNIKRAADQKIDFSEQFFLKCTPEGGCDGGYIENALKVLVNYGAPPQSNYPYRPFTATSPGICSRTTNMLLANTRAKSFYDLSDNQIKNLVASTPLAIAIDSTDWQYYTGGTWKCNGRNDVNHAVLLVGYTADGKWIIKNQWGTDWGQNGYIYVTMDPRFNCKIGVAVHMLDGDNVKLVNGSGSTVPIFNPSGSGSFFGFGKSEYHTQIIVMALLMLIAIIV